MAKSNILNHLFEGFTILIADDGHLVIQKKRGPTSKQVKTDAAFKATREIAKEFGKAGTTAKLLRRAFAYWISKLDETHLSSRLVSAILPAIRADTTNAKGERNLLHGQPEMLEGFNFNTKKGVTGYERKYVSINKEASTASIKVRGFLPTNQIFYSSRELHCRIISLNGMIDMSALRVETDMQMSDLLLVENRQIDPVELTNKIDLGKNMLNFLTLGIEFCYVVNGEEYTAAGGSNDPLTIIKVIRGA